MASSTGSAALGLGDQIFLALYSPPAKTGYGLNDGVDEVLAGADLLEATLDGQSPPNRREAKRWIEARQRRRRDAEIERLCALGIVQQDAPAFIVKLPGSRDRGLARVPDLVVADARPGAALRDAIIRALRDPGGGDGRTLCLAMLIDAGPWMESRVAPGQENADVRARVKRIRTGQDVPAALTTFLDGLGVEPSTVLTVIDAARIAVKNSRSW